PDRPRYLLGHRYRPGHRRRRLRDQAILGRGAGGPGPRGAAAHRAHRGRRSGRRRGRAAPGRRPGAGRGALDGPPGRCPGRAVAPRVPAAGLPDAAPGRGAAPRPAAGERVGLGLRRGVADRRDLRQLPAPQARPAGRTADPHPAGGRLQPAGPGRMSRWRRAAHLPGGSLRTRLLLLQLGVATLFLIVLGTVGTLVLSSRLNRNFNADLIAESLHSPTQLAGTKGAYAAVGVAPAGIPQVVGLTSPGPVTKALAAAVRGQPPHVLLRGRRKLLTMAGNGVQFRAVVPVAELGPAPGDPLRLLLLGRLGLRVIGRPVGEVGGQVRAFVIAELIPGGVLIALLAVGGGALIGRGLEPLGRMARTADGISSGQDLDARMPAADGGSEVGR